MSSESDTAKTKIASVRGRPRWLKLTGVVLTLPIALGLLLVLIVGPTLLFAWPLTKLLNVHLTFWQLVALTALFQTMLLPSASLRVILKAFQTKKL